MSKIQLAKPFYLKGQQLLERFANGDSAKVWGEISDDLMKDAENLLQDLYTEQKRIGGNISDIVDSLKALAK